MNYEDPAVCQGVHSWTYHYDPAAEDPAWEMTATCVDCGRVENWREHLDRKPATAVEAGGRFAAALYVLWRASGVPGWLEQRLGRGEKQDQP